MVIAVSPQEIALDTPTGQLYGTLIDAGGPCTLILPGSGPTDRNGNGPGLQTDAYRKLAEGLAEHGITTLRIDKRGIAASAAAMTREEDVQLATYVDDAVAWTEKLREHTGAPSVFLVGHSEGGLVAALAAPQCPTAGVILIAAAGRKAGEILREQLMTALPDQLRAPALAMIAELEVGLSVDAPPPELAALFRASVQPYLRSWLTVDPADVLAGLDQPVLIVQGETDLQVSVADAARLEAARPDATLVLLPKVNHILKEAPLARSANLATYGDPTIPLAPEVVPTVASWIMSTAAHSNAREQRR